MLLKKQVEGRRDFIPRRLKACCSSAGKSTSVERTKTYGTRTREWRQRCEHLLQEQPDARSIDLLGYFVVEALAAVEDFLKGHRLRRTIGSLSIITGKGIYSRNGIPVVKAAPLELREQRFLKVFLSS